MLGISSRDATDMFTTALMKSGAFAVVERQQINQGFEKERQLKAKSVATGKKQGSMLTGADYIFEGTVSEVNSNESEDEMSLSLKGMNVDREAEFTSLIPNLKDRSVWGAKRLYLRGDSHTIIAC